MGDTRQFGVTADGQPLHTVPFEPQLQIGGKTGAARGIQRTAGHILGVTGVLAASQYQQFLTQSIEQPLPIQHHPQQLRVQSSSCRAIEHRDNRTAAINQRPVAIPASFETGMVPQEQSAARVGASQRTVKHELSPARPFHI